MHPFAIAASALALSGPHQPTDSSFAVHNIDGRQAIAARIAHFDLTLRRNGLPGKVLSCSRLVDLTDFRDSTHTIGAICKIRFPARSGEYAICDNEPDGDGGQAALGLSWNDDRTWLIDFTRNNCIEQAE